MEYQINVKDFGAKGNGISVDTKSIQSAIDECEKNEGGTVYFPPGIYLSGTIHLCDNLELNIGVGATIIASKEEEIFDSPEKLKFPDAQGSECSIFDPRPAQLFIDVEHLTCDGLYFHSENV